jgi:hypothetical protein
MPGTRGATRWSSRGRLCALILFGGLLVTGCGGSAAVRKASVRSSSISPVALASVSGSSSPRSRADMGSGAARSMTRIPARPRVSASGRERAASLAAARRSAASSIASERKAVAARRARSGSKRPAVKPASSARLRQARQRDRAAVARAKKFEARVVKANPSSCLQHAGAVAVSHSHSKAYALRVRKLILGCLSASRKAQQHPASTASPAGVS